MPLLLDIKHRFRYTYGLMNSNHDARRNLPPVNQKLTPQQHFLQALKEGHELLDAEEKSAKLPPTSSVTPPSVTPPPSKVQDALGKASPNPYIKARATLLEQMLPSYRIVIEKMENNELTRDKRYDKFIKELIALGDSLSEHKR